ncbi:MULTISPECIES: VCBS repeat-containing protein [Acidobacteriaceae]|uniref:FG-GAP repeat domain-containing protein n=1 Tax=Acidobacteriaceae TaxID=204434 RepID=UPI00131DD3CE|nr:MULTISPECIES: VCBS repeat-containing protein [Acidobacteriaceae]MDW5265900.1 VCBS repeat-containing protein [Edaphobacter sp.]
MFRTAFRHSSGVFLLVAIAAVAGLAPTPAWAVKPASTLPAVAPAASASTPAPDSDDDDQVSQRMVIGDFNHDGVADMAEAVPAATGTAVLTISLGQADGSFKQLASMPLPGRNPMDIVVGDFNQDGIPDLLVGDDDGTLTLFLGDGTGKMISAGAVAHVGSVVSIAVGDFNHDGILDVAVSDWRSSSVAILLGIGKGSLRSAGSFPLRMAGKTPHVTVADFNGDGIPDLAVVYDDDDGGTYDVMLGNGSGAFTFAPSLSLARDPNSHCVT